MVDHNSKLVTGKLVAGKIQFVALLPLVSFFPALECAHRQNLMLFGKAVHSDFNKVMAQAMRSQ